MNADELSCALVFQPEEEEEETHETAIHCLQVRETNELTDIEEAIDEYYNAILLAIKSDANFKQLPGNHMARQLLNFCDQLSIAKLGEKKNGGSQGVPEKHNPRASPCSLWHDQDVQDCSISGQT